MMSFSSVTQPVDEDLASQEQSSVVYSLETESHRHQVCGWFLYTTCNYDGSPNNCINKNT